MLKAALLFAALSCLAAHADDLKVTPARLPPPSAVDVETHPAPLDSGENDMGFHLLMDGVFYGPSLGVSFNHVVNPKWSIGGTFILQQSALADNEGGDLDSGQHYDQYIAMQTAAAEFDANYFFRHDGARRWGPLLRLGAGYAIRKGTAHWTRYDRDPAFFPIFGDRRSLDSGQGSDVDMSTFYARVGFHYQFVLGRRALANGRGHIIELGVTSLIPAIRKEASYTKPTTGEKVSIESPFIEPALDICYRLVF